MSGTGRAVGDGSACVTSLLSSSVGLVGKRWSRGVLYKVSTFAFVEFRLVRRPRRCRHRKSVSLCRAF